MQQLRVLLNRGRIAIPAESRAFSFRIPRLLIEFPCGARAFEQPHLSTTPLSSAHQQTKELQLPRTLHIFAGGGPMLD